MTAPVAQRCYRHPTVETYVRCTRCERPICADCMIPASVGHQCPECVREGRKLQPAVKRLNTTPYATYGLIGACVVMFVVSQGFANDQATIYRWGASFGPAIKAGEWWRLVAPMFLHYGVLHIGFNMFALYLYGPGLERMVGPWRFLVLYFVAGFAGTALSLAVHPTIISAGASGAVFGLLGAWFAYTYRRRSDAHAQQLLRSVGFVIAINLVLGFTLAGIDAWAHIGGLIGGAAVGFAMDDGYGHRTKSQARLWGVGATIVVLGVAAVLIITRLSSAEVPSCKLILRGSRLANCV